MGSTQDDNDDLRRQGVDDFLKLVSDHTETLQESLARLSSTQQIIDLTDVRTALIHTLSAAETLSRVSAEAHNQLADFIKTRTDLRLGEAGAEDLIEAVTFVSAEHSPKVVPSPSEVAIRPKPQERIILSEGAARFADREGVSEDDLFEIIKDPDDVWEGQRLTPQSEPPQIAIRDDHAFGAEYFVKEHETREYHVIGVKSVSRLRFEKKSLTDGYRKVSAGGEKKPVIDSLEEFIKRAQRAGFEYESGRKHGKLRHPSRPGITFSVPATPSDARSWANTVAQVKTFFNIEL